MLRGKRVLIAADCFPSLHFLLAGLAPKIGFTLHTVPLSDDKPWVEAEDFIAAWDRDVALALITLVTSTASARVDLAPLVARIIARADALGVPVHSPRDAGARGGTAILRLADTAAASAMVTALGDDGFAVDFRGSLLRLSPGVVTRADAVDELFDAMEEALARGRRHRPD